MTTTWQRCFIALTPSAATRGRLAALATSPKARAVAAQDLHLTLAFLGVLTRAQATTLAQALPGLAAPLPPLAFAGMECWPHPQRPRVQVATFALPDELYAVVQRLHPLLISLGLPIDSRPFRPHVTLARFQHGSAATDQALQPTPHFEAYVEALSLYARAIEPDGPRYAMLATAPLARA